MIRLGVIGTGKIVERFLEAVEQCPELELTAVYSRDLEKAQKFGKPYRIGKFYDHLDMMAQDRDIDVVYIASPNSLHCEQSIKMLGAGKHVLCEKPAASNKEELKRVLETAKENNVIFLEAMRSLFSSGFKQIKDHIYKLGKIRRATFQYCQFSSKYNAFKNGEKVNIFNPQFSTGALMDIGVYCVQPMVKLFGKPSSIQGYSVLLEDGIDGAGSILAGYNGMLVELIYSKITDGKVPSQIQGEDGIMLIDQISDTRKIEIIYNNGQKEEIKVEWNENNMVEEAQELAHLLLNNGTADHYNQISVSSLEVMDQAREQMGIHFPADERGIT